MLLRHEDALHSPTKDNFVSSIRRVLSVLLSNESFQYPAPQMPCRSSLTLSTSSCSNCAKTHKDVAADSSHVWKHAAQALNQSSQTSSHLLPSLDAKC